MPVTIKYFGVIEEVTGAPDESISLEEADTLEALKTYVLSKYEGIDELSFQLAVNQTLRESGSLTDGDEIAFLPPFAGG